MAITTTNSKYGSQPLAHQDYYLEHVAGNGVHSQTELKASKTLIIQAQPGEQYRVISDQGEIPDNLVAIRTDNDLEVRFDHGVNLIIEDYYLVCSNNYCGIRLSDDGEPLNANDYADKPFSGESTIVYSQGNIEGIVLLDLVSSGLVLEAQEDQPQLESSSLADADEGEGIGVGMLSLGVAGLSLVAATAESSDSTTIIGGGDGDGDGDANYAPEFTSGTSVTFAENQTGAAYTAAATDPEGDTLTYSITGGDDAGRFNININTGEVTFKNAPDYEVPGDVGGDNTYDIMITTSDDTNSTTQTVAITVSDVLVEPASVVDLSDFTTSNTQGFIIQGEAAGDNAGWSVSSAGDVNGDGFEDLIVGAPYGDDGGSWAGEAYVIYGGDDLTNIDLTHLTADQGFIIQGDAALDRAGRSISSAGDVNGDGFEDLIVGSIGADNDDGIETGEAYVIYGGDDLTNIDLTGLTADQGFTIYGDEEDDWAGVSVSSAGDVNGDGFTDVIVGANYGDDGGDNAGEAYIIYGGTGLENIDLTNLTAGQGFIIQGDEAEDRAGFSGSSAGDVNGDGFEDLIVGAPFGDDGGDKAGEAYVIYGGDDLTNIDLSELTADQGFIIQGDEEGDWAGFSVSSAGDVNSDGFDDVIIGALFGDDGGDKAGEAYVIYGGATGTESTVSVTLAGTADADNFTGNAGDDSFTGIGEGDVVHSGAGHDTLAIGDDTFFSLDGGNGTDTLRFDTVMTLDFTTLSDNKIASIEQIDLRYDGGDSEITLNLTDVLQLGEGSTSNPLIDLTIYGDSGDKVTLNDSSNGQTGSWEDDGTDGTGQFAIYNFESSGNILATVLVSEVIEGVI